MIIANWPFIFAITIIALLVVLYEKKRWPSKQAKGKIIFVLLLVSGWGLAALLIINPYLPGPTQLLDDLFQPLARWLHMGES